MKQARKIKGGKILTTKSMHNMTLPKILLEQFRFASVTEVRLLDYQKKNNKIFIFDKKSGELPPTLSHAAEITDMSK